VPPPALRVVTGEIPNEDTAVSLSLKSGSAEQALQEIAAQAGWSLVLQTVAEDAPLSLSLQGVPAGQALALVLEATGLSGSFRGDVLVVGASGPAESVPAPPAPPEPEDTGSWGGERNVMGTDLTIDVDEQVESAVVTGGSLTVKGKIRGDAVSIGGSVRFEPTGSVGGDAVAVGGQVVLPAGARIGGDAVAVGGGLQIAEGASVGGDQVSIGAPLGELVSGIVRGALGQEHVVKPIHIRTKSPGWAKRIARGMAWGLTVFVAGLLMLAFAPHRTEHMAREVSRRPLVSVLIGVLVLVGTPFVMVFLAVTLIGIPLIPLAVVALILLLLLGLVVLTLRVGQVLPMGQERKTMILALVMGCALLFIVSQIPILGVASVVVGAFLGAGAILSSRFGGESDWDDPDDFGGGEVFGGPDEALAPAEADPAGFDPETDPVDLSDLELGDQDPDDDPGPIEP
jgi:hypothetical protein